ncbi:MAG: hypothetical protein HYR91_05170 [Flavobacteriia bacterium]|nr:hypothetical protein [Flavobacteriia bacterium]
MKLASFLFLAVLTNFGFCQNKLKYFSFESSDSLKIVEVEIYNDSVTKVISVKNYSCNLDKKYFYYNGERYSFNFKNKIPEDTIHKSLNSKLNRIETPYGNNDFFCTSLIIFDKYQKIDEILFRGGPERTGILFDLEYQNYLREENRSLIKLRKRLSIKKCSKAIFFGTRIVPNKKF